MVLVAFMVLMSARNTNFTMLQKIIGVFLFSHTTANGVYAVLSRMGISVAYTTVLKLLRSLSKSSQDKTSEIARTRIFLLIYDNINRMRRASANQEISHRDTIEQILLESIESYHINVSNLWISCSYV